MFAGTRVLYSLAITEPVPQAPRIFAWTTSKGIPLPALLATSSISVLCFGSSFIGSGQLWSWLQNIVGVSNQIAWLPIGLASWRFRKAWVRQGRSLDEMKFRARWTWPWGPYFVVSSTSLFPIVYIDLFAQVIIVSCLILSRSASMQVIIISDLLQSKDGAQYSRLSSRLTSCRCTSKYPS
jgi:AAT family amino acid transporter